MRSGRAFAQRSIPLCRHTRARRDFRRESLPGITWTRLLIRNQELTMHGLSKNLGTTVIYPEDRTWRAAGPLDENGKGIFVSLIYGDLETKGPVNFLMKYSAGVKA